MANLAASVAGRVRLPRGVSRDIPLAFPDAILILLYTLMKKIFALSIFQLLVCACVFAAADKSTKSLREDDNLKLKKIAAKCVKDTPYFGYSHTASVVVENDIYFSDRYYTNGIKFQYSESGNDWWATMPQFGLLRLLPWTSKTQCLQSAAFGQNMYVNSDINIPNPSPKDHPYSGFLYVGAAAHMVSEDRADSFAINLGIVGPHSFAEQTQKIYHDIIGADNPLGWHTQLGDEPAAVLSYNHAERLLSFEPLPIEDFSCDFIGSGQINAGNALTDGRLKGLFRFGFNLPKSFDASRIDYSMASEAVWANPDKPAAKWHCYMFLAATARFVAYDIALDGNTYRKSRGVDSRPVVGEFMVGISSRYDFIQADLIWTARTQDYYGQEYSPHFFWALTVKAFF